ncbi:hypothetical protein [Engelhardtia mirabilis]|uniref:Carboxypeptidase regulatory-like domain-containing protein n=1 Tax=Engelhardtia mirabilis TaxID=2528011 RepID=A0A518BGC2_9BACT|nr:hypothetical protein Pla133_10620 [Planctomycetes bacterium Pla133]QDV00322.1 hypothetical protein Pla86_10610 [Planctomycetes bacterium Pla86]
MPNRPKIKLLLAICAAALAAIVLWAAVNEREPHADFAADDSIGLVALDPAMQIDHLRAVALTTFDADGRVIRTVLCPPIEPGRPGPFAVDLDEFDLQEGETARVWFGWLGGFPQAEIRPSDFAGSSAPLVPTFEVRWSAPPFKFVSALDGSPLYPRTTILELDGRPLELPDGEAVAEDSIPFGRSPKMEATRDSLLDDFSRWGLLGPPFECPTEILVEADGYAPRRVSILAGDVDAQDPVTTLELEPLEGWRHTLSLGIAGIPDRVQELLFEIAPNGEESPIRREHLTLARGPGGRFEGAFAIAPDRRGTLHWSWWPLASLDQGAETRLELVATSVVLPPGNPWGSDEIGADDGRRVSVHRGDRDAREPARELEGAWYAVASTGEGPVYFEVEWPNAEVLAIGVREGEQRRLESWTRCEVWFELESHRESIALLGNRYAGSLEVRPPFLPTLDANWLELHRGRSTYALSLLPGDWVATLGESTDGDFRALPGTRVEFTVPSPAPDSLTVQVPVATGPPQ